MRPRAASHLLVVGRSGSELRALGDGSRRRNRTEPRPIDKLELDVVPGREHGQAGVLGGRALQVRFATSPDAGQIELEVPALCKVDLEVDLVPGSSGARRTSWSHHDGCP